MNVQHMSRTDEWGTPGPILDLARAVLGGIDLDPASSPKFNALVGAGRILTRADDALSTDWGRAGAVFLNPPGGKRGNRSVSALFWKRLMEMREDGRLGHAVFMAFSLEQLAVTQNYSCEPMTSFPLCVPARRISFWTEGGEPSDGASHANAVVYVPGSIDRRARFADAFAELGAVLNTCPRRV